MASNLPKNFISARFRGFLYLSRSDYMFIKYNIANLRGGDGVDFPGNEV